MNNYNKTKSFYLNKGQPKCKCDDVREGLSTGGLPCSIHNPKTKQKKCDCKCHVLYCADCIKNH